MGDEVSPQTADPVRFDVTPDRQREKDRRLPLGLRSRTDFERRRDAFDDAEEVPVDALDLPEEAVSLRVVEGGGDDELLGDLGPRAILNLVDVVDGVVRLALPGE